MMEIVSLNKFNIENIYQRDEKYPSQSYVILNGTKTETIINGVILEECVRIYDYYLLFMTHDCPFEESLTVSLLDKSGKLLEEKDIFVAYYTDDFSDLRLYEPNVVTFDFLYKGLWIIEVFSRPKILTTSESFGFIFRKKIKTKVYWKVSLNLEKQTATLSFRLKKLVLILFYCCGLLYLFGYF